MVDAIRMLGVIFARRTTHAYVECLRWGRLRRPLRPPLAIVFSLGIALMRATAFMPAAHAQQGNAAAPSTTIMAESAASSHVVTGRCVDSSSRVPLAGISVRLFRMQGQTSHPEEIARTITDADGRYTFTVLTPPRPEGNLDRLRYDVVGISQDGQIGVNFLNHRDEEEIVEIRIARETSTLSGKVVDDQGRPIAGATVTPCFVYVHPAPAVFSAITDAEGRFQFDNLGIHKWSNGVVAPTRFGVLHPDYPSISGNTPVPAEIVVTLPTGCVVTGAVKDATTGMPAVGAELTARQVDEGRTSSATTDQNGHFRLVIPEGHYDFFVEAHQRVCIAETDRECLAGQKIELPQFTLIEGGFISGQVVNSVTGQPMSLNEQGKPIALGLFGPSYPAGSVISPAWMAIVDDAGRFTLRAAPGENFPYFVNCQGTRMPWETMRQPPVFVRAGETTHYNMLITPEVQPQQKLELARKLIDTLPQNPTDRTAQIILEFRKLNHTVDETEVLCSLMRELVMIGPTAVPQLCAELDQTQENRMLRRLAFALRAIKDPSAVPALIRAIPKALLPSSSDYGLIVVDGELTKFMQKHDLDGSGGQYFGLGRPVREIFGALHSLTGQKFDDIQASCVSLSQDPRRQVLQQRLYARKAQRWQAWWEANWQTFTKDAAYQLVNLQLGDEPLPPPPQNLESAARIHATITGIVLSPASSEGQHVTHFYDLDTGYEPRWPEAIPKDEAQIDPQALEKWAAESGADLMCVTQRLADGSETFVLRSLGMTVREIELRDLRNLKKQVGERSLPQGRPVGELLMHYDAAQQKLIADAEAAFIYTTREGNMGVIETTDRVTRTEDLTGLAVSAPRGVGFHKGVRFNLMEIVP
ncbi:carboxypeptidase regulatory-like domain-containing protein [Planctomicrobium piriforme]|nr:carboxypeptidase regulatory-like domain-containing protein [Planctomicrobium piriforme]